MEATQSGTSLQLFQGAGNPWGLLICLLQSGAYKDTNRYDTASDPCHPCAQECCTRTGVGNGVIVQPSASFPAMPWCAASNLARADSGFNASVECIIIDDAQDLNLSHLALLKELTDNLAAPSIRTAGRICAWLLLTVAMSCPSKKLLPVLTSSGDNFAAGWLQKTPTALFLDIPRRKYAAFLMTFEDLYRSQLPDLQLHRWTKTIFTWLINPILDPDATGRVTMDHLSRLVTTSLRRAYERGAMDIDAVTLQAVAELMILRRDEITLIEESPPDEWPPERGRG